MLDPWICGSLAAEALEPQEATSLVTVWPSTRGDGYRAQCVLTTVPSLSVQTGIGNKEFPAVKLAYLSESFLQDNVRSVGPRQA